MQCFVFSAVRRAAYVIRRVVDEIGFRNVLEPVLYASMQIVRNQIQVIIIQPRHNGKLYSVWLTHAIWKVPKG